MSLLPMPFADFMPQILKNDSNPIGTIYTNKLDSMYGQLEGEIIEMQYFKTAWRCKSDFLDELGYFLAADLKNGDSELTKRKKISNAIMTHTKRSLWDSTKAILDAITGYDARIISNTLATSDDSIEMGYTSDETLNGSAASYMSTEGTNGTDANLGTWEVGAGSEIVIPGNIYINLHYGITTAILSAAQITQIKDAITLDIVAAYFIVYLGYLDGTSSFILYSGGTI